MQTPISILTAYLARWKEGGGEGWNSERLDEVDRLDRRQFVFNSCFRMTRRHPNWNRHRTSRAVALSRLAYIATSDFPLDRSSISRRIRETPTEEASRVVRCLSARWCLRVCIPHALFLRFNLSLLLSVVLLPSFNISGKFIVFEALQKIRNLSWALSLQN